MDKSDELEWVQRWYLRHCDGHWEHANGVKIETIDNPGWLVQVNLSGTSAHGLKHDELELDRSNEDWIRCWIEKEMFQGSGDPSKLKDILAVFREWVETVGSYE
jgi:hypothetical protein